MRKPALLQIVLIFSAAALTAFLYFAPKTNLVPAVSKSADIDFNYLLESAKSKLQRQEVTSLNEMEKILETKSGNEKAVLLDSLAYHWDVLEEPAVAAGYYEQLAEMNSTEKSWSDAAGRYFSAARMQSDSLMHAWLIKKTISAYEKVTGLNPDNADAKINLAVCYTETAEPMKGIMLLRDVVQKHPENIKAQLNLGFLSIRSGQYDKAIERFEKVLELNPSQSEAHYFLGYSYMNKGEKSSAIESFKKYIATGQDTQLINEANVYIRQLK
ncbi:MAG TPA: tetratricopeptide repeat protein [Bacteroidia bacterium]|nr:tetratricopeptide repeat protein [Bacteroidia bacterium]